MKPLPIKATYYGIIRRTADGMCRASLLDFPLLDFLARTQRGAAEGIRDALLSTIESMPRPLPIPSTKEQAEVLLAEDPQGALLKTVLDPDEDIIDEVVEAIVEAVCEAASDDEGHPSTESSRRQLDRNNVFATIGGMFQKRVAVWMAACFPPEVVNDSVERGFRFYEEATELLQASGISREECHNLVDYVFNRPVGKAEQELGGVLITLHAFASTHNLDVAKAGEGELDRVWQNIDKIRSKHFSKPPSIRSALPGMEPSK